MSQPILTDEAPSSPAAPKTGSTWRPDIQGMRALAVGLVVLAHVDVPGLKGGFIGVDVFFVISGFLITQLLLREVARTGTVSITEFYVRRARRILPAAALVTVVILTYAAIVLPAARAQQTAIDAAWSSVFLSNWSFAADRVDYFTPTDPSLFQHFWSLAVEEQFYLVWPLVVLALVPRVNRRVFVGVTAALFAASLAFSVWFTAADPVPGYFHTGARAYEIAAGALLACVLSAPLRTRWRHAIGITGLLLIVAGTLTFSDATPFPGSLALVPVIGTVLLLSAGPDTWTGRMLSAPTLRYIGDISFSLYLWHWPVTLAVQTALPYGSPYLLRVVLTIAISLGLASLTFHFVERPFQQKRVPALSRGRTTLWMWPLSVIVILAVALSTVGFAQNRQESQQAAAEEFFDEHGFQNLEAEDLDGVQSELTEAVRTAESGAPIPPDYDADALRDAQWSDLAGRDCYASGGSDDLDELCFFGDTEAETTIALVGDSHAGMWLPALDILGQDHNFRVVLFVKLSCGAYPTTMQSPTHDQAECDDFRDYTAAQLDDLGPAAIIASARGQLHMDELDGVSTDVQWTEAVTAGIERYSEIAPRVIALGDVPARPEAEPKDCVEAPNATQDACIVTGDSVEKTSNILTRAAAEAAGAAYVDTEPLVCSVDAGCPLFVGDTPTYGDDSHLNRLWVEYVAPALGDELTEVLP
ncbi:acyltransferase family protein [Microbacterium amylolyticum]|uniref:Peptidoglycan/LPS O-acetylase OafA/YrhL n=1 Tax=Microbacterium amylolyticum TaxID=936337 RepID=A0ABS4ZH75_9MICO|nr:acyltransferase family protein [Microbacterium amylolyticum]MBP2436624.1 peptidoglycan/LPS O-acetylase OafA/YrhL [Microbacterium amylolyticum]